MSKFKVISKDSTSIRYEGAPQYSGTYLGVDYIEFKNISSPNVIDWQIGDYVDYFRTGVRYKLHALPMPKKVARVGSYGGAIVYENVKFFAPTKDLEVALFRDFVINDNGIHFSTRQDVSTYEDVRGIARRIQACMDDLFPGKWRIEVYETDDEDLNDLLSEVKEFSVSQSTCLDALSQIYDTWKGVGWIHTTDKDSGQEVITIGRANVRDADNTTDLFTYGIGNGLTSIRKNSANEGEFATRLYVYGSERNLQPRHYNQFDIVNKDSVDIRNLMIPISEWGLTDGVPDAKKAYIQADDALIEKYGLIPKTLYFDGTESEEIYPSIVGITEGKVREYMIKHGLEDSPLLPPDTNDRIDKALYVEFADDNGNEDDMKANRNFVFWVRGVGFNIAEQGKKTSEGHATISMKSGFCAGRDFVVKSSRIVGYAQELTIERTWDESLSMGFPNKVYPIQDGDEFVLLDIPMPDYYISIAEDRLLEQGKKMLADYTRVSAFYEPEVNAIRMKEVGGVITPGMYMKVKDDDIIETEDHTDYVLIDSLSIDEITEIPTYKITLREEKRAARTYSALEDMIEDAKEDTNKAIKRERQYTDRRFRSSQETLAMLESAFSNFSKGITPATVKTMALLIGDESLQYKFTASRDSLVDVPCPLSWNPETKQMVGVPATLIHMTLGVDSVTAIGSRKAEDYNSWNIISWWDKDAYESPFIEDAEKSYYIYVVASKNSADAWYHMSESDILMYSEDYYYFLVGILNSEYDSSRDFVTLYGFTEVLPGQITTDVLRSADGNLSIDLVNAVIEAKNGATIKGSVKIEDGSLLSSLLAVGEEGTDNVEAFLNGSNFAKIPNHYGKLILASGIPDTTASGSTDLAERAKEARTRVYENGVLSSDYVFLDKGFLGQFYADTSKLKANSTYDDNDLSMLVFSLANKSGATSGLGFRNISSKDGVDTQVSIGSKTGQTQYDIVNKDKEVVSNMIISYKHGLSSIIESNGGQQYDRLAALHVSCSGTSAKKNYAIYCPKGQVAGLRPNTRRVNSTAGTTLDEFDHTILCQRGNGTIPITLPTNKEDGQCYEIWKWGACGLRITAKNNIARLGVTSSTTQEIDAEWTGVIKLVYSEYDSAWLMTLCKTE